MIVVAVSDALGRLPEDALGRVPDGVRASVLTLEDAG